jgi:hypothetical protein
MKKMIFAVLVLLLAAPAWATTVDVTCRPVDGDPCLVEIWYETDGTLPRAFGLDITLADGNIVACEAAMVGECTATEKGHGIFPGTIVIDAGGNVTDYGSPVAPQSDLPGDTLGGVGTGGITVEQGSLYVDGNAPDPCGLLCTLTVDVDVATTMTIAANVSRAGNGVVLEDPDEVATVNLGSCPVPPPDCFQAGIVDCCGRTVTAAMVATWKSLGEPDCWCDPCHCRGDSDGSCVIDGVDVLALRDAWPGLGGTYNPCVDLDYDGTIAGVDVLALRDAWPGLGGPGCTGCPPCP